MKWTVALLTAVVLSVTSISACGGGKAAEATKACKASANGQACEKCCKAAGTPYFGYGKNAKGVDQGCVCKD